MLKLIISSLYFFLPAAFANMMPVLLSRFKLPYKVAISKKLFGSHKTYFGFYMGYIGALITIIIQYTLYTRGIFTDFSLLNYEEINLYLYAFLFGVGALTGDLVKSFFKRLFKIKPGRPWPPFDQIDFVLGMYLFLLPYYVLPWQNLLTLLIATPILHFLVNVIGYLLKLKKVWW